MDNVHFTSDELEIVVNSLEVISEKVNSGYKRAIESNNLPTDMLNDKELLLYFKRAVRDFNTNFEDLKNNNFDKISPHQLDDLSLICLAFHNDTLNNPMLKKMFGEVAINCFSIIMKKRIAKFGEPEYDLLKPNTSKASQKGGCFIATAVYGDYNHPQVMVLRKFRDERLAQSELGRLAIKFYYRFSPWLAEKIKTMPVVVRAIRNLLNQIIKMLGSGGKCNMDSDI